MKNLKSLNVPDSIEHIIVQELLKEKKIEKISLTQLKILKNGTIN